MKASAASLGIAIAAIGIAADGADAAEFYIDEPLMRNGMQIVPAYLLGVEMEPMPKHSAMGADAIHLEADIHAMDDETHGFPEDAWIPYLTISYTIEKIGSSFKRSGELLPMIAKDGPHYANNIEMAGPGEYRVSYSFEPPSKAGFVRHVDAVTGVPEWWKPFSVDWTFTTPVDRRRVDPHVDPFAGASVV
jgi:periplasmic iron binding protein